MKKLIVFSLMLLAGILMVTAAVAELANDGQVGRIDQHGGPGWRRSASKFQL